ncbi:hypothetical protein ACRJ4W_50280 [Streptomyces sp. GLT-R25]
MLRDRAGKKGCGLIRYGSPRPFARPKYILSRRSSVVHIAEDIADLRIVDHRHAPWRMEVMEWAYGPALRPNPYIDELVRLQAIIPRGCDYV